MRGYYQMLSRQCQAFKMGLQNFVVVSSCVSLIWFWVGCDNGVQDGFLSLGCIFESGYHYDHILDNPEADNYIYNYPTAVVAVAVL